MTTDLTHNTVENQLARINNRSMGNFKLNFQTTLGEDNTDRYQLRANTPEGPVKVGFGGSRNHMWYMLKGIMEGLAIARGTYSKDKDNNNTGCPNGCGNHFEHTDNETLICPSCRYVAASFEVVEDGNEQ